MTTTSVPQSAPSDFFTVPHAIRLSNVSHWYGDRQVLDNLTLSIETGKVTALLGYNGVGKSTVIRLIMGLLEPTRGSCETLGQHSTQMTPEILQRIGYTVEGHYLPKNLTVSQTEMFCSANRPQWDHERFSQILSHFGIVSSQKNGHLSRGQRAGVSLACVLSGSPDLLVLDDPALGLDPVNRRALNETILDFVTTPADGSPKTVLLTSHLLDDIERIAENIAILAQGKLWVNTSLDNFQSKVISFAIETSDRSQQTSLQKNIREHIPNILEIRPLSTQLIATFVQSETDPIDEAKLKTLLGRSVERSELTLEDMVMPYLNSDRINSIASRTNNAEGIKL